MSDYLDILARNWSPQIGDPTIMGWITVAAYFLVAFLLAWQWRQAPALYLANLPFHRRLILAICLIMLFLGVNKQLDLQSYLTRVGRDVAKLQGWYEGRRHWQALFVLAIAGVGVLLGVAALKAGRSALRRHRLALSGLVILLGFIVIRASSFFQVDRLINHRLQGVRVNWLMELGGIAMVGASACWALLPRYLSVPPKRD